MTVTAEVVTVLGRNNFDSAPETTDFESENKRRVDILEEHHVAYMHPGIWTFPSSSSDRKRFLSNASPRRKTKLLDSRVRDRTRSQARRLWDLRNQRECVIRNAASRIQAAF